jgi:DNA replication protein DnaC
MTTMRDHIRKLLADLGFHGMEGALDSELDRAEREAVTGQELLCRLLGHETGFRRERSLAYRVRDARLPWQWTIDSFPFDRQPSVSKAQIRTLASLDFVRRAENILLIAQPGRGKTGIAIGLLREACLNGYRGRFYNAQVLLDELYASLADHSSQKLLTQLARIPLMVVDELGYLSLKPEQINAFFRLMDMRYGRVSTIITSNLDTDHWYDLFQRKPLVDALRDRLEHRCIKITIDGPTLRGPESASPPSASDKPRRGRRPAAAPSQADSEE